MNNHDALSALVTALQTKQFSRAEELSLALWQQHGLLTDTECIDTFYYRAAALSELGKWTEIEGLATQFLSKYKEHIDGLYWLTTALYKMKRFDDMVSYKDAYLRAIDRAKPVQKEHSHSYNQFANALYTMSKALVATNHINRAIELGVALYRMTQAKKVLAMLVELFHNHFQWQNLKNIRVSAKNDGHKDICARIDKYLKDKDIWKNDIRISACMIVKDEEMFLEQCLASICEHVDEIIVVDTGSSDATVEIAKRFTDKVFYFKWINDFSAARQESIKYATGNWIFIIDADEKLELHRPLREIIATAIEHERDCIKTHFYDWKETSLKGKGVSNGRILRKSFVRFESAIHNQIVGYATHTISDDMILHHYGYSSKIVKRIERLSQTRDMLKEELASCDSEIKKYYMYYQLGVTDFGLQQFKEAFEWFKKALDGSSQLPKYILLQAYTFCMRIAAGEYNDDGVRKYALLGLTINEEYLDFYYYLGLYYERARDYGQASYFFKKYCVYVYDMKFSGEEMLYSLSEKKTVIIKYLHCLHFRGSVTRDDLEVVRFDADFLHKDAILLYGQLASQISIAYGAAFYETILEAVHDEYIFDNATSLLCDAGEYEKVHILTTRTLKLYPDNILAVNNNALAYWHEGKREKAIELLEKLTNRYPDYTQGVKNLQFMRDNLHKTT